MSSASIESNIHFGVAWKAWPGQARHGPTRHGRTVNFGLAVFICNSGISESSIPPTMKFAFLIALFALTPAQQPEPATVYFYRVEEVGKLDSRKVAVKMEGRDLLSMPEDNYVGFRLAPGKYGLRMRQKQSEMLLVAEAGKRYYIRVSQTAAGFGFNQTLTVIPEDQAVYQMREMKPLEDKNIKDKTRVRITAMP